MTTKMSFEIRISGVASSFKKNTRTREKSAFVVEALRIVASLADGQYGFISHKAWLDSLSPEVRANLTAGSNRNGPKYSLRPHGITAVGGCLSGDDLAEQAEFEGRELNDTDTVYQLSKTPKVE